jgi:RNA-binding motif X-linked protein 2
MDVNLPRDKTTGKTRGFAFLMYEDQRSTVLAVDNLNGANVVGKTLRVDHVKNYKQPKVKGDDGEWEEPEEQSLNARPEMVMGEWLPSKFRADFNACCLYRWRSSFGIRCVLGYFH